MTETSQSMSEIRPLSPEESEVYKEITDTIMREDIGNLRKASLVMSIADKYSLTKQLEARIDELERCSIEQIGTLRAALFHKSDYGEVLKADRLNELQRLKHQLQKEQTNDE